MSLTTQKCVPGCQGAHVKTLHQKVNSCSVTSMSTQRKLSECQDRPQRPQQQPPAHCRSWQVVGAHRELLGKHASERREFTSETQSYFSISLFSSGDKTGYSLIYSHLNTNPSRDTCMPSKLLIPWKGKAARRCPWGLARRCPWGVARPWWMLTSR